LSVGLYKNEQICRNQTPVRQCENVAKIGAMRFCSNALEPYVLLPSPGTAAPCSVEMDAKENPGGVINIAITPFLQGLSLFNTFCIIKICQLIFFDIY
jgi:hypothetical protein